MLRSLFCIPALLLSTCAPRPSGPLISAPVVDVQIQPSADTVFNIVWLRTSVRNRGPKRVWLLQQPDSVNLTCTNGLAFTLHAASPERDSMRFCGPCPIAAPVAKRQPLQPGAERVTYLRIDLNYLFPQSAFPSIQPCGQYFNRTLGAYRLQIGAVSLAPSRAGKPESAAASNSVTVYRKN